MCDRKMPVELKDKVFKFQNNDHTGDVVRFRRLGRKEER